MGELAGIENMEQATGAALDRIARLIDESGSGSTVPPELKQRARERALELLHLGGPVDVAHHLAVLDFSAELVSAIAVDLAAQPPAAARLIDRLEELTGIDGVALGREVLRARQVPQLPTEVAIEVQLRLLLSFTGADAVSLWTLWPTGDLRHISHAGDFDMDAAHTRRTARSLLGMEPGAPSEGGSVVGVAVQRGPDSRAALVARGAPRAGDHRELLLEAAVPVLAAILDRDELRERADSPGSSVVTSLKNRLARMRFDLHDGPQQDVHLLAADVRLLRDQLHPIVSGEPNADRLLGRLDDLEGQLVALDGDLRRISLSLQSPFLPPGSLPDALSQITDSFAGRTGIEPQTRVSGDVSKLTDSQQITLLALIREALSNVREHSEASNVSITITSHAYGVDADVTDDGCGFDPETTLVQAAREGHLGLVGIHERVRMLGGQARIESRPGGPTVVSIRMPAWPRPSEPRPG